MTDRGPHAPPGPSPREPKPTQEDVDKALDKFGPKKD
jgi:hypothetical protein